MRHPSVWVMHFTHLEPFIVGLAVGYAYNRRTLPAWIGFAGLAVFVVAVVASYLPDGLPFPTFHPHRTFVITGVATALGGLFLYALVRGGDFAILWENKLLVFLGKISYGLYVWHIMVIEFYGTWFRIPGNGSTNGVLTWAIDVAMILMLTVIVSMLSYFLIEKPFLNLKSKFTLIQNRAA